MLPPEDRQDLLLLRLGSRTTAAVIHEDHQYIYDGRPSRPLLGVRKQNARGTRLEYAPFSDRYDGEHVPRWILHCRSVVQDRRGRKTMDEREQYFVAMGYFALLVMRRWRKWARREAGLRRLIEKLSVRAAVRHWKEMVKLSIFLPLLQHLMVREVWLTWKLRMEEHHNFQTADAHRSWRLLVKAWGRWSLHRASVVSHRSSLRYAVNHWRSWQRQWRTRVQVLRRLTVKTTMGLAFGRWRSLVSATSISIEQTRLRREEVLRRVLRSLLLQKCLRTLRDYVYARRNLGRYLKSLRARILRHHMGIWRRWLLQQKQEDECKRTPPRIGKCTISRRQPGKSRKGHCRCVYAVSRGQRCDCAPRSHLLRRVEELHRLVAQGLDRRDGGYRLLSHVVQGSAVPAGGSSKGKDDDGATAAFGFDRRRTFSCTSRPRPTASDGCVVKKGARYTGSTLRVRTSVSTRNEEDICEQRTPAVMVGSAMPTAAEANPDQAAGIPAQQGVHLETMVDASNGIALAVAGRARSGGDEHSRRALVELGPHHGVI